MKKYIALFVITLIVMITGCKSDNVIFPENQPRSYNSVITVMDGKPYLAWAHSDYMDFNIFFAHSDDYGRNWSTPLRISSNQGTAQFADIQSDEDNIYLIWSQKTDNSRIYLTKSADQGKNWTKPVAITPSDKDTKQPILAVSGSYIFTAYNQKEGDHTEVYLSRSLDAGKTWEKSHNISRGKEGSLKPDIKVSGRNVFIAYHSRDAGNYEIMFASSADNGNNWSKPRRLTNTKLESFYPSMILDNKNIYLTWVENINDNFDIMFLKSNDLGKNWQKPVRVTKNKEEAYNPVLLSSEGKLFIFFDDYRSGDSEINVTESSNGGKTWKDAKRLTKASFGSIYADVAAEDGKIYLTWSDRRSLVDEVFFKLSSDNGQTWSVDKKVAR